MSNDNNITKEYVLSVAVIKNDGIVEYNNETVLLHTAMPDESKIVSYNKVIDSITKLFFPKGDDKGLDF